MFQRLITSLTFALFVTFGNFQSASSQDLVHGYALDSTASVGSSWTTTEPTPLWPFPQDSGFAPKLTIPGNALIRATSAFKSTATGIYIQVTYNGVAGWVNQFDIRRPSQSGGIPATDVEVGISYFVTNVNNWASLRQAPSTQSYRQIAVPLGEAVLTTGKQVFAGGLTWLSVSYDGFQGWMPTKFLGQGGFNENGNANDTGQANPRGAYPVGEYTIINVNNWASLRSRASRSAGRVTKIPRGEVVYHNGDRAQAGGETWLRVQIDGFSGWMPVQYLGLN